MISRLLLPLRGKLGNVLQSGMPMCSSRRANGSITAAPCMIFGTTATIRNYRHDYSGDGHNNHHHGRNGMLSCTMRHCRPYPRTLRQRKALTSTISIATAAPTNTTCSSSTSIGRTLPLTQKRSLSASSSNANKTTGRATNTSTTAAGTTKDNVITADSILSEYSTRRRTNERVDAFVKTANLTASHSNVVVNDPRDQHQGHQQHHYYQHDSDHQLHHHHHRTLEQSFNEEIRHQAQATQNLTQRVRRTIHEHYPELMYQERETSRFILETLEQEMDIDTATTGWGYNIHRDVHPGEGGYGVVVDIGTMDTNGPCVLLRADMDALPIHEQAHVPYASQHTGRMHACGHDSHTSMLLGAAAVLKSMEDSLPGTVRLVFQPAEEGGAGAKRMIEEGLLDLNPTPQSAMALHVWPTLPSGSIASRPGVIMAASDRFELRIRGVGGHAAMPHHTVDPIVTTAAFIMNLQTAISRNTSPLESGVCSITTIHAGQNATNVIPDTVQLRGTIRALSGKTLLALRERVQHMAETTAMLHGCQIELLQFSRDYYPPTVNDPILFDEVSRTVGDIVSREDALRDTEPYMTAEDFSFVAERIPSTLFFLGSGSGTNPATNYGLHHPQFALDESVLSIGVELYVQWAIRALRQISVSYDEDK